MSGYVIFPSAALGEIAEGFLKDVSRGELDYSKYGKAIEEIVSTGKPVVGASTVDVFSGVFHFSVIDTPVRSYFRTDVETNLEARTIVIHLNKLTKVIAWAIA